MKFTTFKRSLIAAAVAALLPIGSASATSITVYDSTFDPARDGAPLASALVMDEAITIVDGSSEYQGNANEGSSGLFTDLNFGTAGDTDFILDDGIVLTSGSADLAMENTQSGFTGTASGLGDEGLDLLLDEAGFGDFQTFDATVLSFDFTVEEGINAVALDFIFGSEEYPEFADAYPEIAAIFVDGTNAAAFEDGSLLRVTSETIGSGNYVNNNPHDDFEGEGGEFGGEGPLDIGVAPVEVEYTPLDIEYDGLSIPLTAIGALDTTKDVHTIKIAVSDTGDQVLDTGIFVANMRGLNVGGGVDFDGPGSSADDPLLPVSGSAEDGFVFEIFVGDAGIGTDPSEMIFFDPDVAVGYEFTSNLAIDTLMVTVDFGDGIYSLEVFDDANAQYVALADFAVNDLIDFSSLALGFDVFQWKIGDIEASAGVDPNDPSLFVYGLTFVTGGPLTLTQTPITEFVDDNGNGNGNVPLPASLYLFLLGALAMRRRLFA